VEDGIKRPLEVGLVDALTEAVVLPPSRAERAAIINQVVHEIDDVVKWRHTFDGDERELQSLQTVVEAASQHLNSMHDADHEIPGRTAAEAG